MELLAFRLDRGCEYHLRLLEFADRASANHSHGGSYRTDEVFCPVGPISGTMKDAIQRSTNSHPDSRASRQRGMGRRHAPVIALAGRLTRTSEDRAKHDRVCPSDESLAKVAATPDATIGDNRHVTARPAEVLVSGCGRVHRRRYLGHANAEHLAARARGSGTDAHEDSCDARLHEFKRSPIRDRVAHDHGDRNLTDEVVEMKSRGALRDMPSRGHGGLTDEIVRTRVDDRPDERLRVRRGDGNGYRRA